MVLPDLNLLLPIWENWFGTMNLRLLPRDGLINVNLVMTLAETSSMELLLDKTLTGVEVQWRVRRQLSQRWADQCQFGHDSSRNKLDGTAVGQNAYWGGSSVESEEAAVQAGMINAAQAWYDEVSDPGFDSGSISPYVFSSGTGHY